MRAKQDGGGGWRPAKGVCEEADWRPEFPALSRGGA